MVNWTPERYLKNQPSVSGLVGSGLCCRQSTLFANIADSAPHSRGFIPIFKLAGCELSFWLVVKVHLEFNFDTFHDI